LQSAAPGYADGGCVVDALVAVAMGKIS
jgi:hypothetical protein